MTRRNIEELFFHMPMLARTSHCEWERQFAADMAKRSRWKRWTPTQKQRAHMERMVSDMFNGDELDLIER